jgi:hypothetical protein
MQVKRFASIILCISFLLATNCYSQMNELNKPESKKVMSQFDIRNDLQYQLVNTEEGNQQQAIVNMTNAKTSIGPVPINVLLSVYRGEPANRVSLSGLSFSFDKQAWKKKQIDKMKSAVDTNIKSKYREAIDSLNTYESLDKKLADTLLIHKYNSAKKYLAEMNKIDTVPDSLPHSKVDTLGKSKLEKIVNEYDSLKAKSDEYFKWRKETINKYSHSQEFNDVLKKSRANAKELEPAYTGVDKYLSAINKFNLGAQIINESQLTLYNYSFSGIDISYGKKYYVTARYGIKFMSAMPFSGYLSNYSLQNLKYQPLKSAGLGKKSGSSDNKIEVLYFPEVNDQLPDINSVGGSTTIVHVESKAKLADLKYRVEGALSYNSVNSKYNTLSKSAFSFEIENYFSSIRNNTNFIYEKYGDYYYSPGNAFFDHHSSLFSIRTSQPFLHEVLYVSALYEKRIFEVENIKTLDVTSESASLSFSGIKNMSINYNITHSGQQDFANENNSGTANSLSQSASISIKSHLLFRQENSVINLYAISGSRGEASKYVARRITYNGNYELTRAVDAIIGGGFSNSKVNETNINTISSQAGVGLKILKYMDLRTEFHSYIQQ